MKFYYNKDLFLFYKWNEMMILIDFYNDINEIKRLNESGIDEIELESRFLFIL